MTECRFCSRSFALVANTIAVTTVVRLEGRIHTLIVACSECGKTDYRRASPDVAAAASDLLQAPDIEQLRANYECRQILTREGLA